MPDITGQPSLQPCYVAVERQLCQKWWCTLQLPVAQLCCWRCKSPTQLWQRFWNSLTLYQTLTARNWLPLSFQIVSGIAKGLPHLVCANLLSCAGACTGVHARASLQLIRHAVHADLFSKRLFSTDTPPCFCGQCFSQIFYSCFYRKQDFCSLYDEGPLTVEIPLPTLSMGGSVGQPPHRQPLAFHRDKVTQQCMELQGARNMSCTPTSFHAGTHFPFCHNSVEGLSGG